MSYKTYEVRVYGNGTRKWFLNGKRHREDGPAVEWTDGTREWYLNEWWLNGELVTEEEYARRTKTVQELTVAEISQRLGYEVKVVKE